MKKIITITYNRLDISWGPAVHYLELWNNFSTITDGEYKIEGMAPKGDAKPILRTNFRLKEYFQPKIPKIRQALFDLRIAMKLFFINSDNIVYIRFSSFSLFTYSVIKIRRLKLVLELNGIAKKDTDSSKEKGWISNLSILSEKKLIQYAHGIVAVSTGIQEHAQSIGGRNVHCIENGIGSSFFEGERSSMRGKIRIVYVGTFTPWDGAHRIIELAKSFPEIEFHLYGDGAAAVKLKENKTDNVIFHGYVQYSLLPQIYKEYDAGIVLYDIQRNDMKISSLKTLEYAASALPIFSSDVPGQEYITENGVGYLSDLQDFTGDFELFINDLEEYSRKAKVYKSKLFETKSWLSVAKSTRKILKSL